MGWLQTLGSAVIQAVGENLAASSEWGSLHPNLIALIEPCDVSGNPTGEIGVKAPLKDGQFQQQFNWVSPYEGLSNDQKHPALSAQLLSERAGQISQVLGNASGGENETATQISASLQELQNKTAGRSGITKMNSRQIFVGHEPLKLSFTLVFRAYQDPLSEVERPIQTLLNMAFPANLADDYITTATAAATEKKVNVDNTLKLLFPSDAPTCVSLKYKGVRYAPMIIEEISFPIDGPSSIVGDIHKEVSITLGTLRSIDAEDLMTYKNGSTGSLANEAINAVTSLFK